MLVTIGTMAVMVRTHAEDDYDRKLLADVQQHGWRLVGTGACHEECVAVLRSQEPWSLDQLTTKRMVALFV